MSIVLSGWKIHVFYIRKKLDSWKETLKCVIHEGLFHLGRQDPSEIAFYAFSQTTRNRKLAARHTHTHTHIPTYLGLYTIYIDI